MRRFVLILLCVVLPLKAVAAVAIPITGGWSHTHQSHRSAADEHGVAAEASADEVKKASTLSPCDAHAQDSNDSTPVHEHSCPHMGMVSMSGPAVIFPQVDASPESPIESGAVFISVIQEVPSPPPTFLN